MFIIPISDFILRAFGFKTESAEDMAATHDDDDDDDVLLNCPTLNNNNNNLLNLHAARLPITLGSSP